jgi:hypothetical protein
MYQLLSLSYHRMVFPLCNTPNAQVVKIALKDSFDCSHIISVGSGLVLTHHRGISRIESG